MSGTNSIDKPKTVMISYCQEDDSHNEWVLDLADKLTIDGGVHVLLDRYELRAGRSMTHFMERAISTADKVILVMTPKYKEKADSRAGGVGYEYSIISQEIYEKQDSGKFIPVVRKGTYANASPVFLKSILSHIMSDDAKFDETFVELLRLIYDEPFIGPPPIGKKPVLPVRAVGVASTTVTVPVASTITPTPGPIANLAPSFMPLINDILNLTRFEMTTFAKWTIDLNLVSLGDQTNSSLYRLIRTNLIRGEGGLHSLPFILDERQKIESHPAVLYEIPPTHGFISNYFCHEKLRLDNAQIRYEFSEYSNQNMVLLHLMQPFTTLLYLLNILSVIHERLKREPKIEITVNFQSNIRAILYSPQSPFKWPRYYDMQIMEIPGNAASDRFAFSEISTDTLFEMFQRIYGFFVAEDPRSSFPFIELDRKEFDSIIGLLLK
jgi:hypothetical protein